MRKKKFIPFEIENALTIDAATDGRGVVEFETKKIFVEWVVPGDEVAIEVYNKHKGLFIGSLRNINKHSDKRSEPKCAHFTDCGGCKWQMMQYKWQLHYKEEQVRNVFVRIAKLPFGEFLPIVASPKDYYYRNKLEFSFGTKLWLPQRSLHQGIIQDRPVLGFHGRGVFDKLIEITECHLQSPLIGEILNELRKFSIEKEIPYYDLRAHTGYLREVLFRSSEATGELMMVLIVNQDKKEYLDMIFQHLEVNFPEITHLLWVLNPKVNSSYSELPFHVWKGKDFITEKLGNFQFRISPTSFFQTNPMQAERLYDVAKNMLRSVLPEGQSKHKIVYDLYTGTGSIAIFVSDLAEKIVGIEYVDSSIIDARKNCEINNISHLNFYAGDMAKVLTDELLEREGKPDIIITDPPRSGMVKSVIMQILKVLPEYIIYISCHPATQARDADLMRNHYEIVTIQPVDMFPHTTHVENVCLFKRKSEIGTEEVGTVALT